MGVYVQDNGWASRRGMAFIGMVLLHVFLIWGLKSGFAMKVVDTLAPPIVTEIIEEKKDDDTPPPPPPPQLERPPVEVPPPVIDISTPVETNTTALSNVTDKPLPPAPPPVKVVEAPKNIVPAGLRKGATQPDSEEYYPPSSKRLGEQGVVIVKSCLDDKSKLTEATVQTSSNFPKLDEAAIKYAKALRYASATENGKPIPECFAFRVRFQLKD